MNAVLDKEQDEDTRTEKWKELLAGMRPEDARAVRGIFLENDKRGRWFVPEWVAFWKKFGEVDTAGALDEWQATGDRRDVESPGRIVAAGIKARGLDEAKMLMAREDVRASPGMVNAVIKAVARQSPEEGLRFILDSVPGESRQEAVQAIVEAGVDRGGIEQAPALMRSVTAAGLGPEAAQTAFSAILSAAGRGGPEALQEFALQQLQEPWCTGSAMVSVTAQLASRNPGDALDFIAKLPESMAGESIEMAVNQSAHRNPDDIGLWLKDHASAQNYDGITAAYSRALTGIDPSAAEAWARTIKNPTLKANALSGLTRQ